MGAASTIFGDDTWLSRLDRALVRAERTMALVSGIATLALMLLAVWSVLGRRFLGRPLLGYVDYIEALMPLIAVLGIAYVQREGAHVRMDAVIGLLRGRALWLFELAGTVLILGLMLALVWGAWAHFDRSFDPARPLWSRDSSIDVGLPLWPSKIVVPVAFALLCIRALLQTWGYARAVIVNPHRPVAVPVLLSALEQAEQALLETAASERHGQQGKDAT